MFWDEDETPRDRELEHSHDSGVFQKTFTLARRFVRHLRASHHILALPPPACQYVHIAHVVIIWEGICLFEDDNVEEAIVIEPATLVEAISIVNPYARSTINSRLRHI